MSFRWYHVQPDGTANVYQDSPAICAKINADAPGWFGSPEGAIIHGGVIASAFKRTTEETFDAFEAIMNGRRVSKGYVTVIKITASREG